MAEELLCGDTDDDVDVIAYNLYIWISSGAASASALSEMGMRDIGYFELSSEVVGEGVQLPRKVWPKVEAEERLIADAVRAEG